MDVVSLLKKALDHFQELVASLNTDAWQRATPNAEWNVRQLVNHITNELKWVPLLMEGKTITQVGNDLDGDLLGAHPAQAIADASQAAMSAFHQPGALDRSVLLSMGQTSVADYCAQIASDVAIHTWDLAQAIDTDSQIDPGLVELATKTFGPFADAGRTAGVFGPPIAIADSADAQTQLLALTGRHT